MTGGNTSRVVWSREESFVMGAGSNLHEKEGRVIRKKVRQSKKRETKDRLFPLQENGYSFSTDHVGERSGRDTSTAQTDWRSLLPTNC